MNPLLSFVCPCSSANNTIAKMVEQLTAQTFEEWEFLVVDNTKDGNLESGIPMKDSRVRFIRSPKTFSAAIARNTGLQEAKGKYVWFVDSDDGFCFSRKDKLASLMVKLDKLNVDACVVPCVDSDQGRILENFITVAGRMALVAGKTFTKRDLTSPSTCQLVLSKYLMNPWNKIVNRAFLKDHEEVRFQDVHFSNDSFFAMSLASKVNTLSFIGGQPVYQHQRKSNSTSGATNRSNHIADIKTITKAMLDIKCEKVLKQAIVSRWVQSMNGILSSVLTHRQEADSFVKDMGWLLGNALDGVDIPSKCSLIRDVKAFADSLKPTKDSTLFSFDDDGQQEHDAVFILGTGSRFKDAELHIAVHSMRHFCPFIRNIYIVGSKPQCTLSKYNVIHVPCNDPYVANKDANMVHKLLHAIKSIPDLTDTFLACCDDQAVTKPCVWNDFKPKYVKVFSPDDRMFTARDVGTDPKWMGRLYRTLNKVHASGKTAYVYEPHIWSPIDKGTFLKMVAGFDEKNLKDEIGVIFSQYYNGIDGLDHEKLHDHKFFHNRYDDFANAPMFAAYNDDAFASKDFRQGLALLVR